MTIEKKRRKTANLILATAITLVVALIISSCDYNSVIEKDRLVRVTLVESEYYRMAGESRADTRIEVGGTAIFLVTPRDGYTVTDTDYPGSSVEIGDNGFAAIKIPNVRYNVRVNVFCSKDNDDEGGDNGGGGEEETPQAFDSIKYDANGGLYYSGSASFETIYDLNGHFRPNTEIGTDKIYRDGYTLKCWNTEPDGSGDSYGLGSRCDIPKDRQLVLYAQWERWSAEPLFTARQEDGSYTITAYNGSETAICVPEKINGITVKKIGQGAFVDRNYDSVILPKTVETVEDGAFLGAVKEIWFFDSLTYISDAAFASGKLPTVHINAVLPPRLMTLDRHSNYADKVDLLKIHENEKKIVIFGGSGCYFSIDSSLIYEEFEGEYQVINMGLNGFFSASAQADIILNYLHEGDLLIHIPEMVGEMQVFNNTDFAYYEVLPNGKDHYNDRYMFTFEANYDMLSLIDLNKSAGALDSYTRYNKSRLGMGDDNGSYSDNAGFVDEFGDYKGDKGFFGEPKPISYEGGISPEFLTEDAFTRLDTFYESVIERGATPYYAFAAVNVNTLEERYEDYRALAAEYESKTRDGIKKAIILNDIADVFYPGTIFGTSDWHLSDIGAQLNTTKLLLRLKEYLR